MCHGLWCAFTVKALNTAIRPLAKLSVLSRTTHLRHLHKSRGGKKQENIKENEMRFIVMHNSLDLKELLHFLVKMAREHLKHSF